MTSVFIAPDPINGTQFLPGGNTPAAGAQLFCYRAGTTSHQDMYTDISGTTKWSNPILLDSGGNLGGSNEVWIPAGLPAKFVLAPSNDSDPPASPYWTRDNLTGINDTTQTSSEWIAGPVPTFVSSTSFTLVGDQTAIFTPGRRLKTTNTSGTVYSTVLTSVFGSVTTVTVTNDSTALDSGLSATFYGLINPKNTSLPLFVSVLNFGAKGDGVTDDFAAIQAAINSGAQVYFPAGTYKVSSTLVVPNGVSLYGEDRNSSIIVYTGTASAIKNTNPQPAASGYGLVSIRRLQITTTNAANAAGGIEFQAALKAYYEVADCRISGKFKYGVILDEVQVPHIHGNIIENGNGSASANIWITNSNEWTAGALVGNNGFTSQVFIHDNQLNASEGGINIADDGGDCHDFHRNNYNGAKTAIRACAGSTISIVGGDIENADLQTGTANVLFTDTTFVSGANLGTWRGGEIRGITFAGDMLAATSSMLTFTSAANFHEGFIVEGNAFSQQLGHSADIDVTKLRWSRCGPNVCLTGGATHFTGVHNNTNGNILYAPPNSSDTKQYAFGQTDVPVTMQGGLDVQAGSYFLISQKVQSYLLQVINTAGTLQHAITRDFTIGGASSFVDKVSGASATLANTPTVGVGTGFTSGGGLTGNAFVFDTGGQTSANVFGMATVEYHDGNVIRPRVVFGFASRNINGVTLTRPELRLTDDMTGAAWNINTTNLPAGKSIYVRVFCWLA